MKILSHFTDEIPEIERLEGYIIQKWKPDLKFVDISRIPCSSYFTIALYYLFIRLSAPLATELLKYKKYILFTMEASVPGTQSGTQQVSGE